MVVTQQMTSKQWSELSTSLSEVLTATLDKAQVTSVMKAWNDRKTQLVKVLASNATGEKTTRRKKDPNAPKKGKTAYIMFCNEKRDQVKKKYPDLGAKEVTSKLGELWRETSDKDKERFEKLAVEDKKRYEKEMESYVAPEGVDAPKRGRKTDGPKRPPSAYHFFCQDMRPRVAKENPEMKNPEIIAEMSRLWKAISPKDRAVYDAKHNEAKAAYEVAKSGVATESKVESKVESKAEPKSKGRPKKDSSESKTPAAGRAKAVSTNTPGFEYFSEETCDEVEGEHPDWSRKQVQAELAKRWKALTDEDRANYEAEAAQENDFVEEGADEDD